MKYILALSVGFFVYTIATYEPRTPVAATDAAMITMQAEAERVQAVLDCINQAGRDFARMDACS